MVPYENSDRLAAVRNNFSYELHKTKIVSNIARNSMVFITSPVSGSKEMTPFEMT
jgi:hypothetical protein